VSCLGANVQNIKTFLSKAFWRCTEWKTRRQTCLQRYRFAFGKSSPAPKSRLKWQTACTVGLMCKRVARSKNVRWTHMASAERKPIALVQRGPGEQPLVRVSRGRSPLKLEIFQLLDAQRKQQICLIFRILQTA